MKLFSRRARTNINFHRDRGGILISRFVSQLVPSTRPTTTTLSPCYSLQKALHVVLQRSTLRQRNSPENFRPGNSISIASFASNASRLFLFSFVAFFSFFFFSRILSHPGDVERLYGKRFLHLSSLRVSGEKKDSPGNRETVWKYIYKANEKIGGKMRNESKNDQWEEWRNERNEWFSQRSSRAPRLFWKIQKHRFLWILFYDSFRGNGQGEIDFHCNFMVECNTNWMIEALPPTAVRRIKCIRLLRSTLRNGRIKVLKSQMVFLTWLVRVRVWASFLATTRNIDRPLCFYSGLHSNLLVSGC